MLAPLIYWKFTKLDRRIIFLCLLNFTVYLLISAKHLPLFLTIASVSFLINKTIERSSNQKLRFSLLWLGILLVVTTISFFKIISTYLPEILTSTIDTSVPFQSTLNHNLLYPLGLSYYGIQVIGAFIETYFRRVRFTYSFVEYLTSLLFFPAISAGPILRLHQVQPQFKSNLKLNSQSLMFSILLIANGLFKKSLGDIIETWLDYFRGNFLDLSPAHSLIAACGIHVQLYLDFSGYSDIAVGIAALFGVNLPFNFYLPFFAGSVAEYWKRWHISLGDWIRDYVLFPMTIKVSSIKTLSKIEGGGKFFGFFGVLISFLLIGLWHGFTLNFSLWAFYNAILVYFSKAITKMIQRIVSHRFALIAVTFLLGAIGHIFFLFPEFSYNAKVFSKIITLRLGHFDTSVILILTLILASGALPHYIDSFIYKVRNRPLSYWTFSLVTLLLLVFILIFSTPGRTFVYVQF